MAEDIKLKDDSDQEGVPTGGTAEGVADDVDAKLSAGEMVIPEDVVRFYGVDFFMKLRDKAKDGFSRMAEMGQVGNSDEVEAEGVDTDQRFSESEGLELTEEDFVEGGAQYDAGGYVKPIDNPNAPPQRQANAPVPDYTTFMNGAESLRHFVNASGQTMVIPVIQGRQSFATPQGFKQFDPTEFPNPADAAASLFGGDTSTGGGNDGQPPATPSTPAPTPTAGQQNADVGPDSLGDFGDSDSGGSVFGGLDIGDVSPAAEAAVNAVTGTPQAVSFGVNEGMAQGAITGGLTGGPFGAIMGGLFGGVTVADVDNDAVSAALGDDVEADIAAAGLAAAAAGESTAALDGSVDFGDGGQGSGDVSVGVADTGAEADVQGGGVGQGGSGIGGEVETTSVDVDVDGGGGGGGRIVCTELVRQHLMPVELFWADQMHASLFLSAATINGYHWWARSVVRKLRNSRPDSLFSRVTAHIAIRRAEAVEARLRNQSWFRHPLGNLYRLVGEPVSWLIGKIVGYQCVEEYK